MIKAIIFDCFGVLVTENWIPFKRRYFAGNRELFEEATDLGKQLNAGLITYEEFIERIAECAGISREQALREIDGNDVNKELFAYIRHNLKPKFKIGVLSNVGDNWLSTMFSQEQLAVFDRIALSYKMGFLKPDIKAYILAAEMLQVEPNECVFIDDHERHCIGAREAGMQAIVYSDFDQMKTELEALLAANSKG